MFSVTGKWEFRFVQTKLLERHKRFPSRLAALHRIDERWADSIEGALSTEVEPLSVGSERMDG